MKRIACALGVALALTGCTSGDTEEPRAASPEGPAETSAAAACPTTYPATVLPHWARAGFSEPDPSVPHVLGDRGDMAAIVWAAQDPLSAPPAADKSNKILWVARVGAGDGPLRIRAVLGGTEQTVSRTVEPAPGPSIIDLPEPGCWSLDLTWGRHHDHLELGYASG